MYLYRTGERKGNVISTQKLSLKTLIHQKWFDLPMAKGMLVLLVGITILFAIFALGPIQQGVGSLEKEIALLQLDAQQYKDSTQFKVTKSGGSSSIPGMDKLPDMIEICRQNFLSRGVLVKALNVERFSELKGKADSSNLDFALVRIRIEGSWEQIEAGIQGLESIRDFPVHVQEVILNSKGGEILMQVYFKYRD